MMAVASQQATIAGACDAVATALAAFAPVLVAVESGAQISEDFPNLPMAQVYWEGGETSLGDTSAQRTFRGGVRVHEMRLSIDVACDRRNHLGQNIGAITAVAEVVARFFDSQAVAPYFGYPPIKQFHWTADRTNFQRSEKLYPGFKVALTLMIF